MSAAEVTPYKFVDVPAREDDSLLSRFHFDRAPSGFSTSPGANAALAFSHLLAEVKGNRESLAPQPVSVKLRWCCVLDGEPVVLERGEVFGVPKWVSERPNKIWNAMKGGRLLDSLALEGEAWINATDREVWAALAVYVAEAGINCRELRDLNDAVAALVLARVGLDVGKTDLPHPPTTVKVADGD